MKQEIYHIECSEHKDFIEGLLAFLQKYSIDEKTRYHYAVTPINQEGRGVLNYSLLIVGFSDKD